MYIFNKLISLIWVDIQALESHMAKINYLCFFNVSFQYKNKSLLFPKHVSQDIKILSVVCIICKYDQTISLGTKVGHRPVCNHSYKIPLHQLSYLCGAIHILRNHTIFQSFFTPLLLFFLFNYKYPKKGHLLILLSSLARDSQEPKIKRIFEIP